MWSQQRRSTAKTNLSTRYSEKQSECEIQPESGIEGRKIEREKEKRGDSCESHGNVMVRYDGTESPSRYSLLRERSKTQQAIRSLVSFI